MIYNKREREREMSRFRFQNIIRNVKAVMYMKGYKEEEKG